jgi:hypothetical protein
LTTALAGVEMLRQCHADRDGRDWPRLRTSGRGSVVEIDTMFEDVGPFQGSPTVLYVNSQELKNITAKVLSERLGSITAVR